MAPALDRFAAAATLDRRASLAMTRVRRERRLRVDD
jgi:hypothetical protein